MLVANLIEALLAIGDWDEADSVSAAALRGITASFPYMLLIAPRRARDRPRRLRRRAGAPRGRARHRCARTAGSASTTPTSPSSPSGSAAGRTPTRPSSDGLARARTREAAQIRVRLCAKGLRAQAELAALARARRDADAARERLGRAGELLAIARRAAAEAAADHAERRRLARAGRGRVRARPRRSAPDGVVGRGGDVGPARAPAARRLLPLAPGRGARRRRRVARRGERAAPRGARRRGPASARGPCCASSSCSPQRARLDLDAARGRRARRDELEETLGLTPREAEVLTLVARGYTNREIADALVISVKTASVARLAHPAQARRAEPARSAAIVHRLARRRVTGT